MAIAIIDGNIFTSNCQTLVNTINCVGVMGAGIALECRLRYPEMYERYVQLCEANQIKIGSLWLYKSKDRWILNFPTKQHWRYPSKLEYLRSGLTKFLSTYEERGICSIAFPILGADKGGIPRDVSLDLMTSYLERVPIQVEIYRYDPNAEDDLYKKTKTWLLSQGTESIVAATSLKKNQIVKVLEAMESGKLTQLNQLAHVKGIGLGTLEKLFRYAIAQQHGINEGRSLI